MTTNQKQPVSFESLVTDEKIKEWFDQGLREGEDFFDRLSRLNQANDRKIIDVLNGVVESMKLPYGYPPVRFCWLVMGSGGRGEQVYRTDQDNALIFDHHKNPGLQRDVERYFQVFSEKANQGLAEVGFDLCPGEVMAQNPFWRGTPEFWRHRMDTWVTSPTGQNVRNLTIFLDFRELYGSLDMGRQLRKEWMDAIRRMPLFLTFLARDAWTGSLGSPEKNDTVNIKTELLVHLVDSIRVFAIKNQCSETNTGRRIDFLEMESVISRDFAQELRDTLIQLLHWRMLAHNDLLPSKVLMTNRNEWQKTMDTLALLRTITREEFFPNL
jgi:CBS domain-containing protein